jgi:hypothetical protein
MSLKDLEWWTNIHGVEEYEVRGDRKGGGLIWVDSEVGSWFTSTNHKQF